MNVQIEQWSRVRNGIEFGNGNELLEMGKTIRKFLGEIQSGGANISNRKNNRVKCLVVVKYKRSVGVTTDRLYNGLNLKGGLSAIFPREEPL